MKEKIFTRYLGTASGAGLGLSIVHALVVERYSGKVAITDRVEGDYTEGTKVEVWLLKA
jgi:signal transduction histidine kinase